jgi:CheY-like chemotaxis protein
MLSYEKEPKRTELRACNDGENGRTRCLVIEDDAETAHYICNGLEEAGFTVVRSCDGVEGLRLVSSESWDVLILDRMLPGGVDGLSIIQTIRKAGKPTPVLILSALATLDERVRGLRSGGDDYLTKPFAFPELLARVQALLRRSAMREDISELHLADLKLDLRRRKAERATQAIEVMAIVDRPYRDETALSDFPSNKLLGYFHCVPPGRIRAQRHPRAQTAHTPDAALRLRRVRISVKDAVQHRQDEER